MDHMGLQAHEPMKSKANILGDRIDLDHVKNSKSLKHTVPWELAFPHDPIKHPPGCSTTCSRIGKRRCLPAINHSKSKRQDGKPCHFQVLACEWNSDDGDGKK